MLTVFQVCFFVGVGLILLSLIFGSFFEAIGIDGLDLDFDVFGVDLFLPVNPVLYILFATVFGGVGWILTDSKRVIPMVLVTVISLLIAFTVSGLVNSLVIRPLKKAQNTSTPDSEELVGIRGVVSEIIYENGFGEISYVIHGNSYTAPAKATNNEGIARGQEIAICWIENHVFYVTPIEVDSSKVN